MGEAKEEENSTKASASTGARASARGASPCSYDACCDYIGTYPILLHDSRISCNYSLCGTSNYSLRSTSNYSVCYSSLWWLCWLPWRAGLSSEQVDSRAAVSLFATKVQGEPRFLFLPSSIYCFQAASLHTCLDVVD